MKANLFALGLLLGSHCALATDKPKDPTPGDAKTVQMGVTHPIPIRVAKNQATMFDLPEGQLIMNTYGGDRGELWIIDTAKVPGRFLSIKPKDVGIHTVLHIISNTGRKASFYLTEVTGTDTQYDPEVVLQDEGGAPSNQPEIKWVPASDVAAYKLQADQAKAAAQEAEQKAKAGEDQAIVQFLSDYPHKLYFGYSWDEAKGQRFQIERVWDDGRSTYIKATPQEVPALYEVKDGKPSLVNYKFDRGLYTVPKILSDFYVAIGKKKENKVDIHRGS